MATEPTPRPGRRQVGKTYLDDGQGHTRSAQTNTIPGDGQAKTLITVAEQRGMDRAALLRDVLVPEVLAWPNARISALPAVPSAPTNAPADERQMTWIPKPGQLDAIDAKAVAGGVVKKASGNPNRNEFMRRTIAAWLDENIPARTSAG
jgi:hypothetical protein